MPLWILIPLAGIALGGFSEWLKFKSKQERLGASTHELEGTVADLREALEDSEAKRRRLTERVQNLETIVTSEAWDALHEGEEQPALRGDGRAASDEETLPEPGAPEKAEHLAKRVKR
jgi:peptidoglycan hydrolase CwlO-like protein